eukprot:TRINITY_DN16389_c0_g1_i3.p1 TRINITY_DN16389_c0_g1~~TRINITY_DN16389_c0_g1_i3.p1  ORF type:complete len:128 (-),score=32.63 TRINITY_DN16389_c0_g1_i3:165-548(-)
MCIRDSPTELAALLRGVLPPTASARVTCIEAATPSFQNGKQGWYGSGLAFGVWTGVLAGLQIQVQAVSAAKWKRRLGLIKTSKQDSRELAMKLYPNLEPQLARVKDHGRAEAVLIAHWGLLQSQEDL